MNPKNETSTYRYGRNLAGKAKVKHKIKRTDRLLKKPKLQNVLIDIYEALAQYLYSSLPVYTHATSRCKVSKTNCADIPGIKLKPSHSKSKFYNDVDWFKLSCPAGRKFENQPYVVTIKK
jgi:hypothetical protein